MTVYRKSFARIFVTVVLSLGMPMMALANCSDLVDVKIGQLEKYNIDTIQKGLRAGLQKNEAGLNDGRLGAITRTALVELCDQVPMYPGGDDVSQTLDLATDYGTLSDIIPEWRAVALGGQVRNQIATQNEATYTAVRLAAGPQIAAGLLTSAKAAANCGILREVPEVSVQAQTALDLLSGPELGYGLAEICAAFPIVGVANQFLVGVGRLGQMEASLPGAIDDLSSDMFGAWIAQSPGERMPRLLGSVPSVLALLQDYQPTKAKEAETPIAPPSRQLPASCSAVSIPSTTQFYAFTQSALDTLSENVDVQVAFDAMEDATFSTAKGLWDALESNLQGLLTQCALDQIKELILGPEALGRMFLMEEESVKSLAFNEELQDVLPVLETFLGRVAPTQLVLVAGLKAAVTEQITEAINAQVELAAATLAAAAEPVAPVLDTLANGVPAYELPELPTTIGVTDATDQVIASTVLNEAFRDALAKSNYLPATQPEILKGDVRRILKPVAETQIKASVDNKMALIVPVVTSSWSLTSALKSNVLALPQVADTTDDPTNVDLAERLKSLVGVEYPSERLFRSALHAVPPVSGGDKETPLSDAVIKAATALAQTDVADVFKERAWGPLNAEGCGCVPKRPQTAEVYGFYPFWFAPLKDAPPLVDGEDAPALELVDFELVSRLAFYGMEMAYANPEGSVQDRSLSLLHEDRWIEARRDFVNSAHRHRANVDVSFDLRDWHNWTAPEIVEAAERITEQLKAFERVPTQSLDDVRAAIPTLFDATYPDGVTLVFESYDGKNIGDLKVQNLIDIVKAVRKNLPYPDEQNVNVALDFDLIDVPGTKPVLNDPGLGELLLTGRSLAQKRADGLEEGQFARDEQLEAKIVDKILIFLERPTTETKKRLRSRMDRSDFRGKERSEILRSILPVIPPSGHEFVFQRQNETDIQDDEALKYSQFVDDAIYFEDNFSGVGFWPVPRQHDPDIIKIKETIALDWNTHRFPAGLETIAAPLARACTWACPNRAYIALAAAAIFVAVLVLTIRSFYSGVINQIAFSLGAVWIGMGGVLTMLLILDICDHEAFWPRIFLFWLIAILALIIGYNFVQRVKNGPKP